MEIINHIIERSTGFVSDGGMFVGFILVFIECFIPILPLSVFVALNVNAFGFFIGCLISWMATSLGSFVCYKLFFYLDDKLTKFYLKDRIVNKLKKAIEPFSKISFSQLVLIITLPFTPSFLINILCGLTRIAEDKFISALFIGKMFSIIFWGYIGKSLIESLSDISSIIYIIITLIISYIISKIVGHKFSIN